ncbi:MAG: glycosyltransferase family 4 protein [Thainema sp.]
MRVLIPALHRPTKPTGVCRHAVNLAQCLASTHQVSQVTLLIGQWQHDYFEQAFNLTSPKIHIQSVDIQNTSLARNRWFMFGLPKIASQLKPDLIHMSFPFPFIRAWLKVPVISTIHDLYPYECPENFGYPQVWFNQLFLQQCVQESDGLVCVSKCTLEVLKSYFPQVKDVKSTAVIYNIVDFEGIASKRPAALEDTFDIHFLLSVAQHRKNKNLDLLIQVYSQLLQNGRLKPNTQLLLVGSSGPETEYLQALVQTLKLVEQVKFLSGLEDGELRWLYEFADLFVIPSSTEGFCLPLVEALTLACPAVCSDIPIFQEVGALRCRYFQLEGDRSHNLAEAILAGLNISNRRDMPTDLRFSRTEVAQQLINFYQSHLNCG